MIKKADLGALTKIAEGGFGIVYRTSGFRLPGGSQELAYKEFTTEVAEQQRSARAAVDLWERLDDPTRDRLGSHSAWPCALVHDRRRVCGLLMPLLGDDYFFRTHGAINGAGQRKPRTLEWLIATRQQRIAANADVPDIDRLERHVLLGKLVYVLGLLHRLEWVYGDLSFKNVVFGLGPPRVMLVDCDGAAPLADRSRGQSHSPFWDPPEHQANEALQQDDRSDVYKLGLAILRCLTPGKGAATTRDLARLSGVLDADGKHLVGLALSADPLQRPTAKELFRYFERLVQPRIAAPVIRSADVLTPYRLRGQDVQVAYEIDGADTIEIEAANGHLVQVNPVTPAATFAFRVDAAGPVMLVARNRFGASRALAGEVDLYELPRFDIGRVRLPQPRVPALNPVILSTSSAVLAQRPLVNVGTPVAAVPSPDIIALIRAAGPPSGGVPEMPSIFGGVALGGSPLTTMAGDGGRELASVLHDAVAHTSERVHEEMAEVSL